MENIKKELINFWRKFAKLLNSGVPLLNSLDMIKREMSDKELKSAVERISSDIKNGTDISKSVTQYPQFFPFSIQAMIRAGEIGGSLEVVASQIADGLEDGTFRVGDKRPTERISVPKKAELPVVKLVNSIIKDAVKSNTSTIHIEWLKDRMRIRYRADFALREIKSPPRELQEALISRIKIMANMDVSEKRLPQTGTIIGNIWGKDVELHVSTVPYVTGESVVIKICNRNPDLPSLEKQGFSKKDLETVRKWSRSPYGMIIVTGPAGSGKTTTFYALLQELNSERIKITTIEEPVEYQFDGWNQLQINPRLGLTYAKAIIHELRQDPDVMMVGEIRDLEVAQLVAQVAFSGHLVFTTLHASGDTAGAIRRLLDIGIEPYLLNSSLLGILSQRLVRTICKHCKEEYKPQSWIIDGLKEYKNLKFFRGRGCKKCNGTGYRWMIAIRELLEVDNDIKNLINKDADLERLRKQAIKSGMVTMREDGIAKVNQGITTIEEVMRVTVNV